MVSSLLLDIGIVIIFAAVLALITRFFRQPIVIGYVVAGFLIGPLVFGFVTNVNLIKQLAELGVAFLLFMVGLEVDLNKFKQLGWVVTVTAILQVILVAAISTYVASFWLGTIESLYIGLIAAFSSTMIVIKLLSDKKELQTLHGKIILGILLVQDVLVILALSMINGLENTSFLAIASILKNLVIIIISYFVGRYLFNYVLEASAPVPELLFIVALAISILYSGLAYYLGFSIIIGAFIAGVALASSPYSTEIIGRVISLKDFFLVLFFVSLGMQVTSFNGEIRTLLWVILGLVLVVKTVIIFALLKLFKHTNRTAFSTSISLAQISEFSLVLAGLGMSLGHLSENIFSLVIILGAITITLTSYFVKYDTEIYAFFHPLLKKIETSPRGFNLEKLHKKMSNHIVLIGAHRIGSRIIESLKQKRKKFVVLDYNPDRVQWLKKQGITCVYGDYGNYYILENLHIKDARVVISTVSDLKDNLRLINFAKKSNKKIITIINTHNPMDALLLYRDGADFVIFPEYLSGQKIADYLTYLDTNNIKKWGRHYREKLVEEIRNNKLFM